MLFKDSKFFNISKINSAFSDYIKDLDFSSGNDLVKNAIVLESFLVEYFEFNINFDHEFFSKIKIVRNFIDKLNKSYKRNEVLYKKYLDINNYFDRNELIDKVYFRTFYHFGDYFYQFHVCDVYVYYEIKKCDVSETSNIFLTQFKDECNSETKICIELNLYCDDISSYILSILNDDLHANFKKRSVIFNLPEKIDSQDLVCDLISEKRLNDFDFHWQYGDGRFIHSDLNVNYCLKCHDRGKDSCRKGLKNKDLEYQINQLNQKLHGCPLDEHISEAIMLSEMGYLLAALAVMMINNPLLALTGYRICNDCAKSCIFQKQTSVDVPYIETTIFDKIINLHFGVEIYLLLTQWNPLNFEDTLPKKLNDKKVLIVGLGPAGISASYFLLRAGFQVVALEAAKIEKLHNAFIENILINFENKSLEDRLISGFGGVMEYGITSRWNKNYLTIMQLMLERNDSFNYYDGVRFGSNYFLNDAFNLDGFDHVVIATGAGKQNVPKNIKNFMAKNIRFATDFLMNLQLGGAYKLQDVYAATSLQIQIPAIVLGGGLTAIDAATELLNYYPRQILKIYKNVCELGLKNVQKALNDKEKELLDQFLIHAEKIKECYSQESLYEYINSLGGVTIVYHKKIQDCNAYKVNHEELNFAISKGVKFIDNAELRDIVTNVDDEVESIKLLDGRILEAKNLFVACGCSFNPNLLYEIGLDDEKILKFLHRLGNASDIKKYESSLIDEKISIIGDMNPQYAGSVVKAILNGKLAAQEIEKILKK